MDSPVLGFLPVLASRFLALNVPKPTRATSLSPLSVLVTTLIIVAIASIPIISIPGNNFLGFNTKFFKHALEWDYFIGVISFYLLTFLMWKKK